MDSKQKKIVFRTIGLVLLVWTIFASAFSLREQDFPVTRELLIFNASDAYRTTLDFTAKFPWRVLGSIESHQSSGYLNDCLQKLGYQVSYTNFDAHIGKRTEVGRNIMGFKQGRTSEIIALITHYDNSPTTLNNATDNGYGVGALIELARILASKPTHRSILLIFSDGKEWGLLGTLDLVAGYSQRKNLVAALSLDYGSAGNLAAVRLDSTGRMKGFSPPWLRQIAGQAATKSNLPVLAPSLAWEHFERALLLPLGDQGPLLQAGVPAINLKSQATDPANEILLYPSPQPPTDNFKIANLERYGRTAEQILYTLDALPAIPRESSGFFRLWKSLYLSPQAVAIFHAILFLPPLLVFFFYLKNHRADLFPAGIGREALAFLGTVLPFLAIYLPISIYRALRMLPAYSLNTETVSDSIVSSPNWSVLIGVWGTVLVIGLICFSAEMYSFRSLPKPNFHSSKVALLGMATVVIALSFLYNSYWATLFLVVPFWIWTLTGRGDKLKSQTIRRAWMLAAGIPYFIFLWKLDSRLGLSGNWAWRQILALDSGMFTKPGYFLGAAAIAIGIRFIAIQSHGGFVPEKNKTAGLSVLSLKSRRGSKEQN